MVVYTIHWECPYCDASNTQLNHRTIPDSPSEFLKQSVRNEAKKGVKIHIRGSEDTAHGGARKTFPTDWSEDLAEECIEVSANECGAVGSKADSREPSDI